MEKKLKVYKENNMFVLERINQFNHLKYAVFLPYNKLFRLIIETL